MNTGASTESNLPRALVPGKLSLKACMCFSKTEQTSDAATDGRLYAFCCLFLLNISYIYKSPSLLYCSSIPSRHWAI